MKNELLNWCFSLLLIFVGIIVNATIYYLIWCGFVIPLCDSIDIGYIDFHYKHFVMISCILSCLRLNSYKKENTYSVKDAWMIYTKKTISQMLMIFIAFIIKVIVFV